MCGRPFEADRAHVLPSGVAKSLFMDVVLSFLMDPRLSLDIFGKLVEWVPLAIKEACVLKTIPFTHPSTASPFDFHVSSQLDPDAKQLPVARPNGIVPSRRLVAEIAGKKGVHRSRVALEGYFEGIDAVAFHHVCYLF